MKRTMLFAVIAFGVSLTALARPVLQPEVKEYVELGGTIETAALKVFYEDQRQCAIAADETSLKGVKSVWNGKTDAESGVYIAIAGSAAGRKLIRDFKMDVPARQQGYAIVMSGERIAIVGHDAVGALYGAVTFAQMARGGKTVVACVRDWPDVPFRGSPSIGRGLWDLNGGDPESLRMTAIKAGLDEMMRHKLNMFCDVFRVHVDSDEAQFAFWREICRYAAERGIYANDYTMTSLWNRRNVPKGVTYESWPCVKDHSPWEDAYFCWADDGQTEAAANRYADYALKLGVEKGVIVIHPVDGGTWRDPENWSRRCAKCRARWNDHERWKASVNQLNIWTRVLRKRLPEAHIGSCIYPYKFNELLTPEKDRTPQWYEGNADYWRKLSEGLEDKEFFFSSWISSPTVFKEFRRLVPNRPLHFSDTYPRASGIFQTYHRKAGSVWEESSGNMFSTQGAECYTRLYWESSFLVSEYTWNRAAPGAEAYDGGTYYDPLVDHTGPKEVIEDALVRICRTFWGEELAPHLVKVMSSGVMPGYLKDPAASVQYWNDTRKNPDFDPNIPDAGRQQSKLKVIVDTPELMRSQITAAETCVRELRLAWEKLDGLDRYKRKYFMSLAKNAPYWLATARALYLTRKANESVSKGDNKEALKIVEEGRLAAEVDFAAAVQNVKALAHECDMQGGRVSWPFDMAAARKLFDRTEASARVTLKPRKIGRKVKIGIAGSEWQRGIKEFFDDYENVEVSFFDSIALSELDAFDCVILTDHPYDKTEFFSNVKAYVERGGGGAYLEGSLCGHKRFVERSPFPEIAEKSCGYFENFKREMRFADGRSGRTMYVDYFGIQPGAKGEAVAFGPDGETPLAVRGESGLGKVYFCGTFNLGTLDGSFATKVEKLNGANAELTKEAVEYLTGVRLKRKGM